MQEEIYDRRDKSDREYHSRKSRHIKRTIIPEGMSKSKLVRCKMWKISLFLLAQHLFHSPTTFSNKCG